MTAPVLFLIFNRPDTTARVFEAIRAARPSRLYVAADGPRADRPGEAERCAEARRIATAVDWPCELKVLFRNENLGCRRAVFGAISWFFDNEAEGIILEDDLLPDPTFFEYCDELLERYRDDPRIMAICGGGYGDAARFGKASYTFARSFDPWGWASWRRAWEMNDGDFQGLDSFTRHLGKIGPRGFDCAEYWARMFRKTQAGTFDTWDFPWMFSIFKVGGLVAYPASNLISNIGHRDDATHTRSRPGDARSPLADMPTSPLRFPLSHPRHVRNNPGFEVNLYTRRLELVRMSPLDVVRLAAHRKHAAARARVSHHVPAPLKAWLRSWRAKRVANLNN
jgi:hypothetical protein